MNKLKHLLHSYSDWIKAVLAPLGPWGMLAFAAVDGSFLGMPLDAIFVGYVYHDRSRFLLYVVLGALGSVLGSCVIYAIGYAGGEVLLRKKLSPERFEKVHASFDKHEFWALMFPAMLPPPTPFKVFVLAAAAFEMRFPHFLLAIFAGRFVRFLLEALLTLAFGPQIVWLVGGVFRHHFKWVLAVAAAALLLAFVWWRRKRAAKNDANKNAAGNQGSTLRREETSLR